MWCKFCQHLIKLSLRNLSNSIKKLPQHLRDEGGNYKHPTMSLQKFPATGIFKDLHLLNGNLIELY